MIYSAELDAVIASGELSDRAIARRYGLSSATVWKRRHYLANPDPVPVRTCVGCQRTIKSRKVGLCSKCDTRRNGRKHYQYKSNGRKVYAGRFTHKSTADAYLVQIARWGYLDYEVVGDPETGWFVARVS